MQSTLPDKIDTRKVVEMIKNADLYDLINISLRSNELKDETVELFIQKALMKNAKCELVFTPPSKGGNASSSAR